LISCSNKDIDGIDCNKDEIMNDLSIKNLIAECTAYDYKVALEERKPKSWLKSVSAFANEYGGSLFFGVDNDGIVVGLDDIAHVIEAIGHAINAYMDPLPDIELIPFKENNLNILQLKVHPGKSTPYYVTVSGVRETFIRNCDESVVAVGEKLKALVLKGTNNTFDSLKTDIMSDDNTFVMLSKTYKERTGQEWNAKYLKSFGLVLDDGVLTNAGALFCDDCQMKQSRLYCTRWNGLEKTDAANDAEFSGNILMLLREAVNFIKASTNKGWEKLPDRRKNKPEYADRAILETLVNHFIHRDYMVMGGEVHLDIYDDRIVVSSPGGMYNGAKVQDLDIDEISSERRNPILADVMAQLDYMEKRGSGLKRICDATSELDSYRDDRKPLFKSTAHNFMTTLYSMEYEDKRERKQEQVVTKLSLSSHQVVVKLSLSIPVVVNMLEKMRGPMSAKDMRTFCGQKDSSYFKSNIIDPLIEAGIVCMTQPDSPNSPTQKYMLAELGLILLENELTTRQPACVAEERVNRLIGEMDEALPRFSIGLPKMEKQYEDSLPVTDIRCFQAAYKMKKAMFASEGSWIYCTPELYLNEIQGNIWQHYNVQFLMHNPQAVYSIRFSEIKKAFEALGVDGNNAVIISFQLDTFDNLYGGEIAFMETDFGYLYGNMPIYRVPSHEDHIIIMLKDALPRYETKQYEGPNAEYKLINQQHLLYSNIHNMKDEGDCLGLAMMRDLKFYYPSNDNFSYVKLVVDRMEQTESEVNKIKKFEKN